MNEDLKKVDEVKCAKIVLHCSLTSLLALAGLGIVCIVDSAKIRKLERKNKELEANMEFKDMVVEATLDMLSENQKKDKHKAETKN